MKSPSPLVTVTLLVVFVVGFVIGFRRPASPDSESAAAWPGMATPPVGPAAAGSAAAAVPELTLEQIIAQISDECRRGIWRRNSHWDVLLARLSPADFGRLSAGLREFMLSPSQ